MKLKQVTAFVLCAAVLAGSAGCDIFANGKDKKAKKGLSDEEAIEELVEDLQKGFNDFDANDVLGCTDWDSDDEYYAYVENAMDRDTLTEWYGEWVIDAYKIIASTIKFDYDLEDLEIDGDRATWEMKLKIMDWEPMFFEWYEYNDDALAALKNQKDTEKFKLRIKFSREDGEWLVSSIYRVEDILDFTSNAPYTDEWYNTHSDDLWGEPYTGTETDPYAGLSPEDFYQEAMKHYLEELDYDSEAILSLEKEYKIATCALYDFEGDGVPELIYIADDQNFRNLEYHVVGFRDFGTSWYIFGSNAMLKGPTKSDQFLIWIEGEDVVITYKYDDNGKTTIETQFFTNGDDFTGDCRRVIRDLNDPLAVDYYINLDTKATRERYYEVIRGHVESADAVFISNWEFDPDDPEYPLSNMTPLELMSYRQMHEYLENQIK